FFFSSRRRHTRSYGDWSSDVCSSDLGGDINYYQYILLTFAPVYRPEDVYINELFGGLSQLDDGVTKVHDISQIHHSPAHSDAARSEERRVGKECRSREWPSG